MRITTIHDRALVRLIPQTYHKPPVLRGLVGSDAEAAILAELEGRTSARLVTESEGSPGIDRRELAYLRRANDLKLYGQSHINAAFTYTRAGGNRFNDASRGAWYCSYDSQTSAEEVGWHRTRELGYVGVFRDSAIYVELLADFTGPFPDLADEPGHPALNPDPLPGYAAGQMLALSLRREGHRGLLYPSVRRKGGRCMAAFDPGIIQNVRPGASWALIWDGTPDFSIQAL